MPKGPSLRLTPEKGGHGRCFHRSASAAQGNPDTRGGAGSRGTRQLGPKGSGLEAPNDRLRDQVKKKGWSLGFYDTRNRCRNHAPPLRQSTPRRALITTERHILPFLTRPQRSGDARYEKGGDGSVVRVTAGSPPASTGSVSPSLTNAQGYHWSAGYAICARITARRRSTHSEASVTSKGEAPPRNIASI